MVTTEDVHYYAIACPLLFLLRSICVSLPYNSVGFMIALYTLDLMAFCNPLQINNLLSQCPNGSACQPITNGDGPCTMVIQTKDRLGNYTYILQKEKGMENGSQQDQSQHRPDL